jgi:SAM-dependent methyltransferase
MNDRLRQLARLPRRVLSLLAHGSDRIDRMADDTRRVSKMSAGTAETAREIQKRTRKLESEVAEIGQDIRALARELHEWRAQLNTRLFQYNAQLGRLAHAGDENSPDHDAPAPQLSARTVSPEIDEEPPGWSTIGDMPHPDPEGREWLLLETCPMCGHGERTVVNEWNKLVLLRKAPDPSSARYDFAVCHACGVAYATRRPVGERYKFLNLNFGDVTAKHGDDASFTNPLLNPYPLTDADRETLKRRAAPGVFVSDHLGLKSNEYLEGLMTDRLQNSAHLDVLGALVAPHHARVLEIRPRTGAISEGLRRLFGADVRTMPIWESQELLLKEVYCIESLGLVDYDQFDIPGERMFDLIVCNHMLTHAVRPQRFFAAVHRHLEPGGHVYFYNEPDDAEFLAGNQSMFATLNPLHMQAFDLTSLGRALAANGLEVVFHKRRNFSHIVLARLQPTTLTPMTESDRKRRVRQYRKARDRAILGLRGDLRARFADEWPQVVERGVAERLIDFDEQGRLRLVVR